MRAIVAKRIARATPDRTLYRARKRAWNQMSRPQREQFLLSAKNRTRTMAARVAELLNPPKLVSEGGAA